MIKMTSLFSVFLLLAASIFPGFIQAEVNWQARETIKTGQTPLDIHVTADGKRTLIITEGGKLQIYDNNARLIDTIEVDPAIDILSADGTGGRVFLGNSKTNSVVELRIEYIADFSYDGSPFLGNNEAPVVLAFFSDFQ
ncbi:MAG: hypothetical protein ABFS18_00140 [Thermodesulfobacteriota bacterium]